MCQGVVLDASAGANLLHHLQVERRAHAKPLGFQQLVLALQFRESLVELLLDGDRMARDMVSGPTA